MAKGISNAGWLSTLFVCSLILMAAEVHGATPVTFLESAIPKGAVCLDGSAPAYYYVAGSGNGVHSWIIYLQGGGWCSGKRNCLLKSTQRLGSSCFEKLTNFSGILDSDCKLNPDLCDWHRVLIHYCDGSTFMSDIKQIDPKTNLTFRGARIFKVMMEEMLSKGMGYARNAILAGSSSGGVATMLYCDKFRKLFPIASRVKCISDSGFPLHGKGRRGDKDRETFFFNIIRTHVFIYCCFTFLSQESSPLSSLMNIYIFILSI